MRRYKEVNPVTKVIRKVLPSKPRAQVRKRVAAYARVSSGKDAMLHSLSAQVSYYSELIQKNPAWTYVGVYTDEALTGTKDNRPEFQRLLADCRAGKVDMVITKSISRLARNTVTLLETVRELKALGVDIYFEEQNIHSMSGDGELMLTILASYAQDESRNVSENCTWRIRKRFEAGELVNWRFQYGYRIRKGQIFIEPDEALTVRWVFDSYLNGTGITEISESLRERNVPSYRGGTWSPMRVLKMLKNEKYTGNAMLQKRFVADHLKKLERTNRGELPKYYAEGTHPAIIPQEVFSQAQAQMERNRVRNGIERNAPQYGAFTGMLRCDKCRKMYHRKVTRTETAWNCSTFLIYGKKHCHSKQIPEDILMDTTASVLGLTEFDEAVFKTRIQEIRVPAFNHLVYVFKDGTEVERVWKDKSRRDSWTDEMKAQAASHARKRYAHE
jgi:DNA invertase Pin-like site-specific DNA recombinase